MTRAVMRGDVYALAVIVVLAIVALELRGA
jgi:hypothetical protein